MESWESTNAMIAAAKRGDREAFTGLVKRYEGAISTHIRRHAGRRVQGKVSAEDMVQDVFLRAFRGMEKFQGGDEKSLLAWLHTISEHVILEHARKMHREVSLDERRPAGSGRSGEIEMALAAKTDSPFQRLRREERFERLKGVLRSLKPDHAKVIWLARVQGLSIGEVARRMDRTPEATSMLLLRALKKLKAAFGETESFHLPPRSLETEAEADGEGETGGGDGA